MTIHLHLHRLHQLKCALHASHSPVKVADSLHFVVCSRLQYNEGQNKAGKLLVHITLHIPKEEPANKPEPNESITLTMKAQHIYT